MSDSMMSDGCEGEHSPAGNRDCEMGPGPRRRPPLKAVSGREVRAFDPAAIAAEALERGEDPLSSVVGQYGGYLSSCWENLAGAGIFESTRARDAADATVEWLHGRGTDGDVHYHQPTEVCGAVVELGPDDGLLLIVPDADAMSPEQAIAVRDQVLASIDETMAQGGRRVTMAVGVSAVVLKAGATL